MQCRGRANDRAYPRPLIARRRRLLLADTLLLGRSIAAHIHRHEHPAADGCHHYSNRPSERNSLQSRNHDSENCKRLYSEVHGLSLSRAFERGHCQLRARTSWRKRLRAKTVSGHPQAGKWRTRRHGALAPVALADSFSAAERGHRVRRMVLRYGGREGLGRKRPRSLLQSRPRVIRTECED